MGEVVGFGFRGILGVTRRGLVLILSVVGVLGYRKFWGDLVGCVF